MGSRDAHCLEGGFCFRAFLVFKASKYVGVCVCVCVNKLYCNIICTK